MMEIIEHHNIICDRFNSLSALRKTWLLKQDLTYNRFCHAVTYLWIKETKGIK